ncbi:hypothetical protein JI721_11975 [Alicyclobacillus cycloheptanicus]|uniref:Uncharacterized protein n=1 Tax=Alicyclobacillus cycloheptanicus TaxID=1457 RepID=A0ABT9XG38_9BACL|nr:hypothetical protein [Alicyclobacillus cycloheptanicus]MDQ0189254.1 hypothetical protein [Alicyclobacillus cycloheptanicus]WDM00437.1 hypothetical protein JI721_11975 [Alicyclobacillus cycloheptanicus]
MHACLSCFSMFKAEIIRDIPQESIRASVEDEESEFGILCPTADCSGQVIEIDELILLSIFVLNYKGYVTKNCCAGHINHQVAETYIMFAPGVKLPDLPQGFVQDELEEGEKRDHLTIRKLHDSSDRIGSILLTNKKLYDWTRGLPNLNEEHIEQGSEIDHRHNELLIMRMLAMGFSPYKQNIPLLMKKKTK